MAFDWMNLLYIIIATILLWLVLLLATRLIITKNFAKDKKLMLFLCALVMVVLIPIITGFIGSFLGLIGDAVKSLRDLIDNGGANYLVALVPIISFLLFILVLHFFAGMNWEKTVWVALVGLFFLYILFSLIPELNFMGSIV